MISTKGNSMRVLVVEDEKKIAEAVKAGLTEENHEVTLALTGEDGFYLASADTFDLVILDIMLPGRDGIEVLSTLRKRGLGTPVLILTAKDAVEDRVLGLDTGADDYMTKPFALPELLARVRAIARRGQPEQTLRLKAADLEIDLVAHRVTRDSQAIDLTAKEFAVLECLLRHQGHVVSREMLAREVWDEITWIAPLYNVIDVHIARLRRKVDEPFPARLIQTVRGVGFIVREDEQ
jgi:two-component system, OmpR family, copper resistance phosphate regulon response regulator CusR